MKGSVTYVFLIVLSVVIASIAIYEDRPPATSYCRRTNCVIGIISGAGDMGQGGNIVDDQRSGGVLFFNGIGGCGWGEINSSTDSFSSWSSPSSCLSPWWLTYDAADGYVYGATGWDPVGEPTILAFNLTALNGSNLGLAHTTFIGEGWGGNAVPEGLVYDRVAGYVDVFWGDGNLTMFNASTGQEVRSIGNVRVPIDSLGVNPVTGAIYAAGFEFNNEFRLSVLNPFNGTIEATTNWSVSRFTVDCFVEGVVYDPSNYEVYVSMTQSGLSYPTNEWAYTGNITVFNSAGTRIVANISTGTNAGSLAYDPANGDIYVDASGGVAVINGSTNEIMTTVPTESNPVGLTYDLTNRCLYLGTSTTVNDQFQSDMSVLAPPGSSCPVPPSSLPSEVEVVLGAGIAVGLIAMLAKFFELQKRKPHQ